MFWKFALSAGTALAFTVTPVPALAQNDAAGADAFAALAGAFEVEPLTAEQEARLPLARQLVDRVLPEGTMGEMMGSMFEGMLGPLAELAQEDVSGALQTALGYSGTDLGIDEAAAAQALAIVDPGWRERQAATTAASQEMTRGMMARMEPVMRTVMAELYAIHFTEVQLRDIDAFFATETGAIYARESYRMASNPRIAAALFADPELMFGAIAEMGPAMEAALANVPVARAYGELSSEEVNRLSRLTGLSKPELQEGMAYAAGLGDYTE